MSNMTIEEWAIVYMLRFGAHQIRVRGFVEGEVLFLSQIAEEQHINPSQVIARILVAIKEMEQAS